MATFKYNSGPKEQVGKAYTTENYVTTCECGEKVVQEFFLKKEKEEGVGVKEPKTTLMVGFCKCGNVFISQYPEIDGPKETTN